MGNVVSYYRGLTTFGSAGLITLNVGFQPTGYKLTVGQVFGITDTADHVFVGGSDGTRQHTIGHFDDINGRQTFTESGKVISQRQRVGGVVTEVLRANHDSMQPTGPRINVVTPNTSYQVLVEAWG